MASIKPLKVQVIADTKRFNTGMKNAGRGVKKFTSDSKKHLGGLKNTMSGLTGKMPMLAGVLGTAALIKAGKDVIEFDAKLARLRIAAKMSAEDIKKLEKRFLALSKTTSQSAKELLSGYSAIIERTGDVELANKTLERMGIVATASGSSMEQVGTTFTNLKEKIGLTIPEIERAMNIFTEQGKMGAFSLAKMAKELPQILSTAGVFGVQGEKGIRTLGTLMQLGMRAYGGIAEQARTGIQGVLRDIPKKRDEIAEVFKFDIFTKKDGVQTLKSLDVILRGILTASEGNALLLGKVFSGVALDTLAPLLKSYQEFGFKEYDTFMNVVSTDEALMKDFGIASATTAAQLGSLGDKLFELSVRAGAKPIESLNAALTELNEMQFFANIGIIVSKLTELQGLDIAAPFRILNEVIEPIAANIKPIIDILKLVDKYVGTAAKLPFEALKAVVKLPFGDKEEIVGDFESRQEIENLVYGTEKTIQKKPSTVGFKNRQAIEDAIFLGGGNSLKTIQNSASSNITNTINNQTAAAANREQPVTNININIVDGIANATVDNGRVSLKTTSKIKQKSFFGNKAIGQ